MRQAAPAAGTQSRPSTTARPSVQRRSNGRRSRTRSSTRERGSVSRTPPRQDFQAEYRPIEPPAVQVANAQGHVRGYQFLSDALPGISDGSTVTLRAGTHYLPQATTIQGNVTFVGSELNSETPVIVGRFFVAYGSVYFRRITLQSDIAGSVLNIRSGNVFLYDSYIRYVGAFPNPRTARGADAALHIEGGVTHISGGGIGPGYSQAVHVQGGSLTVTNSSIRNPSEYAIYLDGGATTISWSSVSAGSALFIRGSPYLRLLNNSVSTSQPGAAIWLRGAPTGEIRNNVFTSQNWACTQPRGVSVQASGNRSTIGAALTAVTTCPRIAGD